VRPLIFGGTGREKSQFMSPIMSSVRNGEQDQLHGCNVERESSDWPFNCVLSYKDRCPHDADAKNTVSSHTYLVLNPLLRRASHSILDQNLVREIQLYSSN